MGRIRVLTDALINRIAAGEVVERPVSVVKELLENSLDAGARAVDVRCEAGGRKLIRVTDDGCGMDRDDALLALERHATSKLAGPADLDAIATLGFRGEALSSIAAVSRLLMRTSTSTGEGTEIEVHGGRIQAVREAGLPRGTSIAVERLFFNVPARRKFLRSEATELSHIARLLTRYALAYPSLRVRLEHGGRALLQAEPAQLVSERIAQIYGREFAAKLLPFEIAHDRLRIHGFAGRPVDALPRRDGQHLFVNGRAVQDRMLSHAVAQAYGNTMPRGRYPSIFLFVECEPTMVDVNVHPQKSEVRFRGPSQVHDAAREAVGSALGEAGVVPRLTELRPAEPATSPSREIARAVVSYLDRTTVGANERPRSDPGVMEAPRAYRSVGEPDAPLRAPAIEVEDSSPIEADVPVPLAQYRDSYILAQDARGLILVDQHAAHERVLFERLLAEAEENRVEIQQLLFPVTLELPPAEHVVLEEEAAEFRRLGFLLEPFGGSTVRIDGVPALAAEVGPAALLRELLGEAAGARSAVAGARALRHKLVTSAACQAAIKINHRLEPASMQRLLEDLYHTVNPSTCPHGRPLVFRVDHDEIERAFRRR